jgi:acetyl esterase
MTDLGPGPFDAEVATLLETFAATARAPFEALSVDEARQRYRDGRDTVMLPKTEIAHVRDIRLRCQGGLNARLYRDTPANDAPQPALLFFHGGGWVIGDLDTHDAICRRLASASGRMVIAVDYRLAPEHLFPTAVDDAIAAYREVRERATELAIDLADLAVGGDSAGGALAAVLSIDAAAKGVPTPSAVVLFYPVTDLRGQTPSYARVGGVPITRATMAWFRAHYLARAEDASDWRTSPYLAPSLAGFPPTFITTAGHDPLCDEGVAFAGRLRDAGVEVEHRHLPGQLHGYLTLGRFLSEADRSITAAGTFLRTRTER